MLKPGRKSTADLATITISTLEKPEAPSKLNQEQRDIWDAVVQHLPATFFRPETHDLLAAYCRHIDYSNYSAQQADEARVLDDKQEIQKQLKRHKEEAAAALTIAQKLGFTTPNYERQNKKPGSGSRKLGA